MTTSEDIEWIRARAEKLSSNGGMEYADALVKACEEREKHVRQTVKKANRTRQPLRVTLAELVKETKR